MKIKMSHMKKVNPETYRAFLMKHQDSLYGLWNEINKKQGYTVFDPDFFMAHIRTNPNAPDYLSRAFFNTNSGFLSEPVADIMERETGLAFRCEAPDNVVYRTADEKAWKFMTEYSKELGLTCVKEEQ